MIVMWNQLTIDIWDKNYHSLKKEVLSIDQSAEKVNLLDVTPFEWDNVHFFKPYTPVQEIYATVGYEWDSITETVSEGMNQIVFLNGGEVVCYVYGYPVNNRFGIFYSGITLNVNDNLDFRVTREDYGVITLSK